MSLDHLTTEELEKEIARREAIGCWFKVGDFVTPKRDMPPYFDSRNTYKVVSTKDECVRLSCDDGKIRGVHQDEFYLTLIDDGEEEFGGPDESFF